MSSSHPGSSAPSVPPSTRQSAAPVQVQSGETIHDVFERLRNASNEISNEESSVWEMVGQLPGSCCFRRFGSSADRIMFTVLKLIALFDVCWVPLLLSFGRITDLRSVAEESASTAIIEFCLGCIYILGWFMRFTTSAIDLPLGREYLDWRDIASQQVRCGSFWADFLSIPGNFWWVSPHLRLSAWRLLRMWRLPSSAGRAYEVSSGRTEPVSQQVIELLGGVWLMAHFFACSWFSALTWYMEDIEEAYAENADYFPPDLDEVYLQTLRDGAAMLVGWNGPIPISKSGRFTTPELIYWIVAGPFASMYMAYMFARLLVVIDRMGSTHSKHTGRMDKIDSVLKSLAVPDNLMQRVLQYHAFLSVHNIDKSAYEVLFHGLSSNLHVELKLFLFENLVLSAPFFREVPPGVVMQMVTAFEEEVYSPGDMVVKKGEVGNELFFIIKGSCEVLIDDEALQVVAVKHVGEYFGEVALVFENQKRSAWIRARTFCVLAKLTRTVFESSLAEAPQVKDLMIQEISRQQKKTAPQKIVGSTSLTQMTNGIRNSVRHEEVATPDMSRSTRSGEMAPLLPKTDNNLPQRIEVPLSARPGYGRHSRTSSGAISSISEPRFEELQERVHILQSEQQNTREQLFQIHETLRQIHGSLGLSMPEARGSQVTSQSRRMSTALHGARPGIEL